MPMMSTSQLSRPKGVPSIRFIRKIKSSRPAVPRVPQQSHLSIANPFSVPHGTRSWEFRHASTMQHCSGSAAACNCLVKRDGARGDNWFTMGYYLRHNRQNGKQEESIPRNTRTTRKKRKEKNRNPRLFFVWFVCFVV